MANTPMPKNSPDMERALIGALLSDGAAMCRVAHIVSPESFYNPKSRGIYDCMYNMFERGEPIDLVTVGEKLRGNKKLEDVGGVVSLAEIASDYPSSANIEHYAEVIESDFYHRSTLGILADAVREIQDKTKDAEEVMTVLLDKSAKLKAKRGIKRPQNSFDAVKGALEHIEHVKSKKYTGGLQTGIERVDRIIVEFEPGELIIIAARPSIGKTVLGQTIAEHNSANGIHGMFFSLEMGTKQVVMRTMSRESGVPLHLIRSRWQLSRSQYGELHSAAAKISEWPITYDENRYENARQIGNSIRAEMMRKPIKYVVIDQLSKIVPDSIPQSEYRMHLNNVINGLKNIATSLGITVFLLHQINRDVKDSKDYRPRIDDLKDTGMVEEAADGVILIHRPEYYNDPRIKKLKIAGDDYDVRGHAEIIIAKRRQGATGSAAVGFIGSLTKFHNLDEPSKEGSEVSHPQIPDPPSVTPEAFGPQDDLPF